MSRFRKSIVLLLVLCLVLIPASKAMTVYDPINAALNQITNSIMNAEWVKDIALAVERLNELKMQTLEVFRVNTGMDDIIRSVVGDPIKVFQNQGAWNLWNTFGNVEFSGPAIELLGGQSTGAADIRHAFEQITGQIPAENNRPYIPFEEMITVDAFNLARQIRESGIDTRNAAEQISAQAKVVSPKGAVRLQAEGISNLMTLEQQNQEVMAKLLELNATRISQITRVEKQSEEERIKYLRDANEFLDNYVLDTF